MAIQINRTCSDYDLDMPCPQCGQPLPQATQLWSIVDGDETCYCSAECAAAADDYSELREVVDRLDASDEEIAAVHDLIDSGWHLDSAFLGRANAARVARAMLDYVRQRPTTEPIELK